MKRILILAAAIVFSASGVYAQHLKSAREHENNPYYSNTDTKHLNVSNAEWKKILPPDLYATAREAATERPFTGKYWNAEAKGTYYCAVCGNELFVQRCVGYFNDLTERFRNHRTSPASIRLTGTTFLGLFKPALNKFMWRPNVTVRRSVF